MSAERESGPAQEATPPSIATAAERDSLMAGRPAPHLEPHLTPGGGTEFTVHQTVEVERETRIASIQERLDAAQNRLRNDHARAMVRGQARADFERER